MALANAEAAGVEIAGWVVAVPRDFKRNRDVTAGLFCLFGAKADKINASTSSPVSFELQRTSTILTTFGSGDHSMGFLDFIFSRRSAELQQAMLEKGELKSSDASWKGVQPQSVCQVWALATIKRLEADGDFVKRAETTLANFTEAFGTVFRNLIDQGLVDKGTTQRIMDSRPSYRCCSRVAERGASYLALCDSSRWQHLSSEEFLALGVLQQACLMPILGKGSIISARLPHFHKCALTHPDPYALMTVAAAAPLSYAIFRSHSQSIPQQCSAALMAFVGEFHAIGVELFRDIEHFDSLDPTARRWSNLDAIAGVWLVWNLKGEKPTCEESFEGAIVGIALAHYARESFESARARSGFGVSKFDLYAIAKHVCQLGR